MFSAPSPHAMTLPPLPNAKGILFSPQFRSHQETKMAAGRTERLTRDLTEK